MIPGNILFRRDLQQIDHAEAAEHAPSAEEPLNA